MALREVVWVNFGGKSDFKALLAGRILVSVGMQTGYARVMPKLSRVRRLQEAYRFPGFYPANTVHGVFGDSLVRVLALGRRQKKQPVGFVVVGTAAFTIRSVAWCETYPVASIASIWSSWCAA